MSRVVLEGAGGGFPPVQACLHVSDCFSALLPPAIPKEEARGHGSTFGISFAKPLRWAVTRGLEMVALGFTGKGGTLVR